MGHDVTKFTLRYENVVTQDLTDTDKIQHCIAGEEVSIKIWQGIVNG